MIAKQGSATGRVSLGAAPKPTLTSYVLPGTAVARGQALVSRRTAPLRKAVETWGMGTVHIEVPKLASYPRLVATVLAGNRVVSHGGLKPHAGRNVVKLANYCVYVPKGTRLRVTVGPLLARRADRLPRLFRLRLGDDRQDHPPARDAREADLRMKRVAALLALVLASTAGAASTADPGVTATTILLGGTVPLSGEASAFGSVGPGAKAYFDYVNSKEGGGGVHGRKIKYIYYDDGYDPAKTVQQTRKLVEQDKVFAIFNSIGTANNAAIQPYLNAKKVPQLFVGTALRRRLSRPATRGRWASSRATSAKAPSTGGISSGGTRARRSPSSSRTTTSART